MEFDMVNYVVQNGFAIAVAIYLLYERTKFNEKVTESLVKISETLERIEQMHLKQ